VPDPVGFDVVEPDPVPDLEGVLVIVAVRVVAAVTAPVFVVVTDWDPVPVAVTVPVIDAVPVLVIEPDAVFE
jgi:hypothetical protein